MYPGQRESPQSQWLRDLRVEEARCVTSGLYVASTSCMAACQTCSPTDILDFWSGQSFSVSLRVMIHELVFEALATFVPYRGLLTANSFTVCPYGWVAFRGWGEIYGCGVLLLKLLEINIESRKMQPSYLKAAYLTAADMGMRLLVRSETTVLLNYGL